MLMFPSSNIATLTGESPVLSTVVLMVECPVHEVRKTCLDHGSIHFIFAENVHLFECKKILEPGDPSKSHKFNKNSCKLLHTDGTRLEKGGP